MAHELTQRADGFTEMAFVGELPWHGLGQELAEGADMETWRKAAGMDWTINTSPVKFEVGSCNREINDIEFPSQNVLYRSDNNTPLSIVSDRYKPVQPAEVLEFFDSLVKEAGFKLHTAGTLRGGKRLWALAETGKFGEVCKDDGVGGFLLLSTSCDRTLATTARFTSVRVVCNNTLTMAQNDIRTMIKVPHSTVFDHDKVKLELGQVSEAFGSFMEMAKFLQNQKLNQAQAKVFLTKLMTPQAKLANEQYNIEKNKGYSKILEMFEGSGKGADLVGFTKWGMLNAVTEYYDHIIPNRSNDTRLDNAWFGSGDRIKNQAVNLLLTA
jgi:phage/plasmid-like protein (TIGR03299 family)